MEFGFVLRSQSVFLMAMLTVCCVEAVALEAPSTTFNLSTDQYSLYQFKREISYDSYGMLASWTERVHVCDWRGVTCNVQKERVVALDLRYCSLGGTICPFSLTSLSLHINIIHGNIPEEIGTLVRLDSGGNNLSGNLDLSWNLLSGRIPSSFGNCTSLLILSIFRNKMIGALPMEIGNIPPSLGNLSSLQWLALSYNSLMGDIPKELSHLKRLENFIHPSIYNLSSLICFDASHNSLVGSIPPEIGELVNLTYLRLDYNYSSGSITSTMGPLNALDYLDLSVNRLYGAIPSSLGNCSNLFYLFLSQNQINGTIPASLLAIPLLTIDLSDNNLSGIIPDSFKNQRHIQEVNISRNHLLGKIPKYLQYFQALRWLNLSNSKDRFRKKGYSLQFFHLDLQGNNKLCVLGKKVPFKIEYKKVSYQELFLPTNGYDSTNLIGIGSFGSVYKGTLSDGMVVAVKVLHLKHHRDFKSFIAECKALSEIRQRDLIKLVTCCITHGAQGNDFKALILQYMCIGSLNKWVHPLSHLVMANEDQNRQLSLNLLQRLYIAIDVAYAVDDNVVIVKYGFGVKASIKGNVYSFGILLLELFTGKKPTDDIFTNRTNHCEFVKRAYPHRVIEIVDKRLLDAGGTNGGLERLYEMQPCLVAILGIGLSCSLESPKERMDMRGVLKNLQDIKNEVLKFDAKRERAILCDISSSSNTVYILLLIPLYKHVHLSLSL
ncbi:hypothetical protein AMTRI_Chr07g75120 [Amborella trichopoda]